MDKASKCREIKLVAAMCLNRGIGHKGQVPWRLRSEYKFFLRKTIGQSLEMGKRNACIMGRITYFGIPEKFRPLKDRINIVLSSQPKLDLPNDVHQAPSLDAALDLISGPLDEQIDEVFVVGGVSGYKLALDHPNTTRIYLTKIDKLYECDAFFPEIDPTKYRHNPNSTEVPQGIQEENGVQWVYTVYERIMD